MVGSRAGGQHCDGVYHQPPIRSLLARHRFLNGLLTPKRQILKKARSPCTRGVNPEVATTSRIIAVYQFGEPVPRLGDTTGLSHPTSLVLRVLSQTVLADPDFDPDGIFAPHRHRPAAGRSIYPIGPSLPLPPRSWRFGNVGGRL